MMQNNVRPVLVFTLAALAAFATLASSTISRADDFWGCELNIAGDQHITVKAAQVVLAPGARKTPELIKAAGKVDATTDYWLTESQIRTGLDAMIGMIGNMSFSKPAKPPMSPAERKQKVDDAMKKEPRIALFLLNCGNEQAGVTFSPGRGAKYADFPFQAASHDIATRASARQVDVMMHINGAHGHEGYLVSAPGTLKLTQFDLHGLTGEFSFPAQQITQEKKKVQVTGHFHLHCIGEKCAR